MPSHPLPNTTFTTSTATPGHDRTVVVEARTPDGALVGSALARRAPMAIAYFEAVEQGMQRVDYEAELDTVAFLDSVAVDDERQGEGIATALLEQLSSTLAASGTRVLFGAIPRDENSISTARFAENRGFMVLQSGQRLPNFFGRRWTLPHSPDPLNWYFARLPSAAPGSARI